MSGTLLAAAAGVGFGVKNAVQPVNVLAVVYVGHLGAVDVKGRNGNAAGNVVPVAHDVFFGLAHGKGTTLNEY